MKSVSALAAAIFALLAASQAVGAQLSYSPRELVFTVYADGYVVVDYAVEVDPTRARVNITLFGSLYQDLFVEDQDGLPLDYSQFDGGLTVDTLGSTSVFVSYVTPELTDKSGQIWNFTVSTTVSSNVLLPKGATIVGLNVIPLAMGSLDGRPLITMPIGDVEVAYTVGVLGTREHALVVIKDAESTIEAVKNQEIAAPEAEALLQQAYTAFDAEQYVEAEQFAGQAKDSALSAEAAASSAEEAINEASAAISAAIDEGRTVGLETAEDLLEQAEDAYEAGDYAGAEALAEKAQSAAAEATAPKTSIPWFTVGGGVMALVLVVAVFIFIMRRPAVEEPLGEVDLEGLFEQKPHLRLDDREVIRFLAESGGEAFATEIRDRFNIPRTSAWRMIRRLQREDIVDIRSIGGQSLVRIKSKYRMGRGST